jgi:hypothetical protein
MKGSRTPTLIGIIGIATGLTILFVFPIETIHPAIATIKVPGAYPYEDPVRVPVLAIPEASPAPSPAPFLYAESLSPTPVRDSRMANARRPLNAKAVRKAAFKYNGVANFFGFLAALPADVGVLDPQLGRTRALVKGGRVIPKNVTWLRKRK